MKKEGKNRFNISKKTHIHRSVVADGKPVFTGTRGDTKFVVVLIGLVIIFKKQLTSLIQSILSKITSQSNSI